MLRQLALPSSQLSEISRAINLIRERYDQSIRVDELARTASMSATFFHRHFRAVTAMSPLQFQKRIRLQEARRRLLSQEVDAARVSSEVATKARRSSAASTVECSARHPAETPRKRVACWQQATVSSDQQPIRATS